MRFKISKAAPEGLFQNARIITFEFVKSRTGLTMEGANIAIHVTINFQQGQVVCNETQINIKITKTQNIGYRMKYYIPTNNVHSTHLIVIVAVNYICVHVLRKPHK